MVGIEVDLDAVIYEGARRRFDTLLFSESNTRFIVEVKQSQRKAFLELFQGISCAAIGKTWEKPNVLIRADSKVLVDLPLDVVKQTFMRKVV